MTNKKHKPFVLLFLALIGIYACELHSPPALAQNDKAVLPKIAPVGPPPPVRDQKYWNEQRKEFRALTNERWAFEQWTGNDSPYAALRARIDQAISAGQPAAVLASQYAKQAKKEPDNPTAQFAWAYAVNLANRSVSTSPLPADIRLAAEVAVAEAPQPHTYNYDRLHYLIRIQGGGGGGSHFLKDLAARLVQRDPHDFPVLVAQSLIYTQNRDPADRQHGYALVQQMIKDYPTKPETYDALGCWYYSQYMFVHNPPDYHQAIAYYQKALTMYPVKSARRASLPSLMDYLTTRYYQISGS